MKKLLAMLLAGIVALSAMSITLFATDKVLYESTTGTTLTDSGDYTVPWDGFGIGNAVNDKTIGDITWDEFVKIAKAGGAQLVINFKATPWGAGDVAMKSQFNCWDGENGVLQVAPEWTTLGDGMYQTVLDIDDCVDVLEANGGSLDSARNFGVQLYVMDCTIYSVKLIIPETGTVTLFEADFESATTDGWSAHGGMEVKTIGARNALYTYGRWNAYSRTGHAIGAMTKGITYTVSFDVYVEQDPNLTKYNQNGDVDVELPALTELPLTAMVIDYGTKGFEGEKYISEIKTVKIGEWTTVAFTYTPSEDLANVGFALNAETASDHRYSNPIAISNLKVTYPKTGDNNTPENPENPENPEEPATVVTNTGYFSTGDDTHAIIIGDAIITSNHVLDTNGNCIYCGHHKDIAEEEIVVEVPVESNGEEVDTDDVDNNEDETVDVEEKEDTNPTTGIALAVVPMAMAALAVVASKRR